MRTDGNAKVISSPCHRARANRYSVFRGWPLNLLGQLDFAATRSKSQNHFRPLSSFLYPYVPRVSCRFFFPLFFSLFSFFPFFEEKLIRRFRSRSADFLTLKKQPIESRENEPSEKLDLSCTLVFGILFGIFVGKRSVTWMVIKTCFWFSIN